MRREEMDDLLAVAAIIDKLAGDGWTDSHGRAPSPERCVASLTFPGLRVVRGACTYAVDTKASVLGVSEAPRAASGSGLRDHAEGLKDAPGHLSARRSGSPTHGHRRLSRHRAPPVAAPTRRCGRRANSMAPRHSRAQYPCVHVRGYRSSGEKKRGLADVDSSFFGPARRVGATAYRDYPHGCALRVNNYSVI